MEKELTLIETLLKVQIDCIKQNILIDSLLSKAIEKIETDMSKDDHGWCRPNNSLVEKALIKIYKEKGYEAKIDSHKIVLIRR